MVKINVTIIQIQALETGQHLIQSQSGRTSCWMEGWIEVPAHLDSAVWETLGWCDLQIEDGKLVGITPTKRPEPVPESTPIPTQEERLSALEEAMLSMMGVSADV